MDFVSAHKDNSKKMENVSTTLHVRLDPNGTVNNVLSSHVLVEHLSAVAAHVVKPQSMLAPPVLIGMETDASTLPTSAQQV